MRQQLFSTLTVSVALIGLMLSGTAQARMKCWTNNEGVKECGQTVPPEYAQQGHQEVGKGGVVREEVERAKTDEEIAEEKKQAAIEEEKRKKEEAAEAERKRIQAEKDKENEILLKTFSSVEDIERARDERITALEASIKLTQARNEKIELDLDKRIQTAAAQERAGKAPSEALLKDIESLKRQIKNNNDFIEDKRKEQEEIKKSHDVDIERFKKLKGIE